MRLLHPNGLATAINSAAIGNAESQQGEIVVVLSAGKQILVNPIDHFLNRPAPVLLHARLERFKSLLSSAKVYAVNTVGVDNQFVSRRELKRL